jgi:hypothetical protein
MATETIPAFIDGMVEINPDGGNDPQSSVGAHLRIIKTAVKRTFTAVTGEVSAVHSDLNTLTYAITRGNQGPRTASATIVFTAKPTYRDLKNLHDFPALFGHAGLVDSSGTYISQPSGNGSWICTNPSTGFYRVRNGGGYDASTSNAPVWIVSPIGAPLNHTVETFTSGFDVYIGTMGPVTASAASAFSFLGIWPV